MGEHSAIEWTDHTFNPWWGCFKVSAGCKHCYAESLSTRFGHHIWGPAETTLRRTFGAKHWAEPLKWNAAAQAAGQRRRVFCASMADVFEDHPQLPPLRAQLFDLIAATPALDWLLLTKRPENIASMLPTDWGNGYPNVWLGTTAEDQQRADERIPILIEIPAVVRFLSCEPLLTALDLSEYLAIEYYVPQSELLHWNDDGARYANPISWVICGGESGAHARPMNPVWARSLRDQCAEADVPFFFKQWGEWAPWSETTGPAPAGRRTGFFTHADVWHPSDGINPFRQSMVRVGKKPAGRLLDGQEWSELPAAPAPVGV